VALDDITINLDRIAWTERHRSGSVAIFFSALSGSSANGYGDMIEIPEEMGARLLNFLDTIAVVI
jgi:hypothetical protein